MRRRVLAICLLFGCQAGNVSSTADTRPAGRNISGDAGRDIWFKNTYGNEVFLTLIFPTLPGGFQLAVGNVLGTPRNVRFDVYGVINDPDCTDGDASTGFLDKCADPNATGIIGIRKFPNPNYPAAGPPLLIGTTCAACHTGLSAQNPPANPNHPTWDNIEVMPGNPFLQVGKLFGDNLSTHDPRYQVFHSWAPGALDTTAIWTDHINNPLAIANINQFQDWPQFQFTVAGVSITAPRQENGGQDDTGCQRRSLRVYLSEGMCARECSLPAAAAGVPIDIDACRAACPTFAQAEQDVAALCDFMRGWQPPRLSEAPGGDSFIDGSATGHGEDVFNANCASCHTQGNDIWSDDQVHPMADIGTNTCAARTSNWMAGRIWAQFSSDQYKARPTGGPGFMRDVNLQGVWASAPLLHTNRLGAYTGDPSVAGRVAAFEDAMSQLLNPASRVPFVARTTDFVVLPGGITLPAGTPVAAFADSNGAGGTLCPNLAGTGVDFVENFGHNFGAGLSDADKYALTEFLKTL